MIDYSIALQFRKQGYGKKMLEMLEDKVKVEFPFIYKITAEVKKNNLPSENIFRTLGYCETIHFTKIVNTPPPRIRWQINYKFTYNVSCCEAQAA
jgi:predicted acetyltransferase